MPRRTSKAENLAGLYLEILADRGIDYLFANSGTDFAPIIEAMCRPGARFPVPISVPHENVAISMAHGYYMVSGRPQAVMVHVSVGTGNAVCGIINASRSQVPVLFTAGRSPITETGPIGTRDVPSHWSQEMFDQAGMVREMVKWEYELRTAEQVEAIIDRALNTAMTEPYGPVYLTLPREVIGAPVEKLSYESPSRRAAPSAAYPDPELIAKAGQILLNADNPLIITSNVGRDPQCVEALGALAELFALPVSHKWARVLCLPTDHPMHVGYDPDAMVANADAILVLDCDVPWIPDYQRPGDDCPVIHMGPDPIFSRYPVRGFHADLAITCNLRAALPMLASAMRPGLAEAVDRIARRRDRIAAVRTQQRKAINAMVEDVAMQSPLHPAWVCHCVDRIKDDDAIIIEEGPVALEHLTLRKPRSHFRTQPGGLGWGLGAALGAKLAAPERLVICFQGDGSYMLGSPAAAHSVGRQYDLPVLYIVFDNSMWGAVRRATHTVYPTGHAARSNDEPFVRLTGTPHLERVVEACDGYGERVEDPAELPAALERAINAVTKERRQAVLSISTRAPTKSFFGTEMGV
jgi:acetolactate synthase-1/2/3 large subunit